MFIINIFLKSISYLNTSFVKEKYFNKLKDVNFNLLPLLFASGIILYFVAPSEPALPMLALLVFLPAHYLIKTQFYNYKYLIIGGITILLAGMGVAKLRTITVKNHQLHREITGKFSGTVINIDYNRGGHFRYLIKPEKFSYLPESKLPSLVRLSVSASHQPASVGMKISGLVRMRPISGPAYPGSYDFSRSYYFKGIGASGFFMGRPQIENNEYYKVGIIEKIILIINKIRNDLRFRIKKAIKGEPGDIAIALIVGDDSGINYATVNALRKSGLAHILAISGLHMALVTLTVTGTLRFLFALSPRITLNYPAHKWSVIGGFITASLYLAVSGFGIATQRAWIMTSIVLLAVLLDKRALTMRNVAITAMIIMIISPESVLEPGFQMSFAAVVALISGYDAWYNYKKKQPNIIIKSWFRKIGSYMFGTFLTSLIAGLATALFAVFHFHALAPLGLLANLFAMPVVSILVIPLGLISILLIPLGFDQLTFPLMGESIEIVVLIAMLISDWSGQRGITGNIPPLLFFVAAIGFYCFCLMESRLRLIGLAMLSLIFITPLVRDKPALLISEDGRTIAVREKNGQLSLVFPKRNKFISNIWLKAYSKGGIVSKDSSYVCDEASCIITPNPHTVFIIPKQYYAMKEACHYADIILTSILQINEAKTWKNYNKFSGCTKNSKAKLITLKDLRRYGAHSIFIDAKSLKIEKAIPNITRPWHQNRN